MEGVIFMLDQWIAQSTHFRKIIQHALYPTLCLLCDAPVANRPFLSGMDLCSDCAADLPHIGLACAGCALPLPVQMAGVEDRRGTPTCLCGRCQQQRPLFNSARAVFHYQAPIDGLILGLKFSGYLHHARLLGQLMAERLTVVIGDERPDVLLPVPLHRRRLRERGYNQSLELARHIGRRLGLPVWHDACERKRDTASQSSLPARERGRNVHNAFNSRRSMQGRYVAIIDDVMTTGSTVGELSAALLRAGARRVDVWVCARASV